MTRCKKGDLAIIIKEFEGCEGNIGKIVSIVGNPRQTKYWGIIWKIKPVNNSGLWIITCRKDQLIGKSQLVKDSLTSFHCDDWLYPIKDDLIITKTSELTEKKLIEKV